MSLWACKSCQCKDAMIVHLEKEVEYLREIVRPRSTRNDTIPLIDLERDAVMSGQEEIIEVRQSADPRMSQDEIDAEASRILSGAY